MSHHERGTGRTYRQVAGAVERARAGASIVYIVHTGAMIGHVRNMLRQHFAAGAEFKHDGAVYGHGRVRIVRPVGDDELRGYDSRTVVWDHAAV